MFPLTILITLTVFILSAAEIIRRRRLLFPPGPRGIPIVGNLHQLGDLPHRTLHELSRKHGPLMYLKLGFVPTIVASSPETARELLKTHDIECCSRPPLASTGRFSYDYLDLAFSPYSDYWREVQKISILELFCAKKVQSFRYVREEEVEALVETISRHSASGKPVDVNEKTMSLSAAVICRVGFGMRFRGSEMDSKKFKELVDEGNAMLGSKSVEDYFPYVGWIVDRLTGLYRRREKCFHVFDEFYEKMIRKNLENENEQGQEHFMDVLLRIKREQDVRDGERRFTRNHVKAILLNLVIAGIDAASVTLEWAMAELIKSPIAMKKAQTEIRNCVKNKGVVKEEDLEKLEYLKMVIKETLRLHPPVTLLLPREAMSKFQIQGYDINPKTRIQVNVWAIGRDPSVWKDPEEFLPERFRDNGIDLKGKHFELLPFGGGRRGCPGINMGMNLVELGLANLLYRFDWKVPEGTSKEGLDMEERVAGLSVRMKSPLQLVPVEYNYFT